MRQAADYGSVATLSPPSLNLGAQPMPRAEVLPTRFLDGLRGLAAFYVLMHHAVRLAQNETRQSSGAWAMALRVLGIIFHHGHAAVIFFFVLSGFVIHLRYARQLRDNPLGARFNWTEFVIRRVRRLDLVLPQYAANCSPTRRHRFPR